MSMLLLSLRPIHLHHVRPSFRDCLYADNLRRPAHLQKAFTTSSRLLKKAKTKQKSEKDSGKGLISEKPTVRWYQQLFPWSTKREPISGEFGFAGERYDEAKWLKGLKDKYDAEVREMEGEGGKTTIEPLLAALPEEDAKKVREEIRKSDLEDTRREKIVEAIERRLITLLPKKEELEILCHLPPEKRPYLNALNDNLFKASRDVKNPHLRKILWQSYARCKAFLPPFLHLLPGKSWNILWNSQQSTTPEDPHWSPHVIILAEDMLQNGKRLDIYQRILYVEALNMQNHHGKAIEQWKELKGDISDDHRRASDEHELLGVRLFASHGDPTKAEKIAFNFLGANKHEESRILIPILHAWTQRGDDIGIQHAWALYLRFRTHVGNAIMMDDYDNISMAFLGAGRTDIALAVFKDMMLTGQRTGEESTELYKKSVGMMERTQLTAVTVDDINRISLTGLITLPQRLQNKYFYGSWLKKLLGMGAVDAAAQVVELMHERGVKPDSRHLNGIIGAWLRFGGDKHREAAEKMAWAMIQERLDLVSTRRHDHTSSTTNDPGIADLPVPHHLQRSNTPATIETFALLLQNYGRRSQHENLQRIRTTLDEAEIRPNVYFINHLLYYDLRRGQHQAAWIKYRDMCSTVEPDLETFACLWDCEKAHLDNLMIHSGDKFPDPRQLMSEMMNWFSVLSTKAGKRKAIQEEFSKELYQQIIRCMGLASDPEGLLVALYALRESFGFYPDSEITRTIILQVSRMKVGEQKRVPKPGRYRSGRDERKANADRMTRVFALLVHQREVVLAKHGLGDVAQFDDYIMEQEGLFRLVEFLKVIMRRTDVSADEDSVQSKMEKAAWDMGVSGISMEDPLPSYGARKHPFRIENRE